MKREILLYGLLMAALLGLLKFLEFRYVVRGLRVEMYIGAIALLFTILGIWMGTQWKPGKRLFPTSLKQGIRPNPTALQELNISRREGEVLELIAQGFSNQEIADKLFISIHTVKTHSSNLFSKLGVNSRTKAIQKAKSLDII